MKLVACPNEPVNFCRVTLAESFNNDCLSLAHADGTVSVHNEFGNLISIFLNPGLDVTCMSYVDEKLIIGFSNSTVSIISMNLGVECLNMQTPFPITKSNIFEEYIALWSTNNNELLLLQRATFDVIKTLKTNSPIQDCFDDKNGMYVVCSQEVCLYNTSSKLNNSNSDQELIIVLQTSASIVGGCGYHDSILVLFERSWKVMNLVNAAKLEEDVSVNAPEGFNIVKLLNTTKGVLLLCSDMSCIFIHNNNIQVLSPPTEFSDSAPGMVTSNATLVTNGMRVFDNVIQDNEFMWSSRVIEGEISDEKFVLGCTNPEITAVYSSPNVNWTGTANGEINGVQVFPGPVYKLSSDKAISAFGSVKLPLSDFNLINPAEQASTDCRVSVKIHPFEKTNMWQGVEDSEFVFLHNSELGNSTLVTVLELNSNLTTLEDALEELVLHPQSIPALEDLAVVFKERRNQTYLDSVVSLLAKMWTASRIDQLSRLADARSLKVLASVYPMYGFTPKFFKKVMNKILLNTDANVREIEAVFWVFVYEPNLVSDVVTPFSSLYSLSDSYVAKFAKRMATLNNEKLVTDIEIIFLTQAEHHYYRPKSQSKDDESVLKGEKMALTVLYHCLEMNETQNNFYVSEPQLVHLVSIALSAAKKHISVGREVLVKLKDQKRIVFHKDSQVLLVPTPKTPGQAGVLLEVNRSDVKHMITLKLNKDLTTIPRSYKFGIDEKTISAVIDGHIYTWSLYGGLMNMFKKTSGALEPDQ